MLYSKKISIYQDGTGGNVERCQLAIHFDNQVSIMYQQIDCCLVLSCFFLPLHEICYSSLPFWKNTQMLMLVQQCYHKYRRVPVFVSHSLDSTFAHNEVSGHPALLTYYITVVTTTWQQATVGGSYQSERCEWCGVNSLWELWFSGSSCEFLSNICSADCFSFNNKSNSLEQFSVESVNRSACWLYLNWDVLQKLKLGALWNKLKLLQCICGQAVMHTFPETSAMIRGHNEHRLNVNVINVGRRTRSFYKLSRGKTMTPSTN